MSFALASLFVLGLIGFPGLSYQLCREFRYPGRRFRGARETAQILVPGVGFSFLGLVLFGIVRWRIPDHTPDVAVLLESPKDYAIAHLPYLAVWSSAIVAVSCLLAAFAGWIITKRLETAKSTPKSAWHFMRQSDKGRTSEDKGYYVQCFLTDGSVVAGYVYSYNPSLDETQDRDICLMRPSYTAEPLGEKQPVTWQAAGDTNTTSMAIINASRIQFIAIIRSANNTSSLHTPDYNTDLEV